MTLHIYTVYTKNREHKVFLIICPSNNLLPLLFSIHQEGSICNVCSKFQENWTHNCRDIAFCAWLVVSHGFPVWENSIFICLLYSAHDVFNVFVGGGLFIVGSEKSRFYC